MVDVNPQFTPLVFIDKTEYKGITGLNSNQIVQTILNEVNSAKVTNGEIEGVYLMENKKVIGLRRFLATLKTNLVLDQNIFVNDNFLLGIFNERTSVSTNKDLFILLKSRSFLDVFPILKNWESKMFADLHGLFRVDINANTNYLLTKNFEDGFVNNKNARILRDKNGKIVLEYIFADDTSVVITNSDVAAQEIMARLVSSQIQK